jgi:hypothetical protein
VEMNLTDFAVIAVLVGVGSALSYAGLWLTLRVKLSERQQEMESQLSLLTSTLKGLEARVAELSREAETQAAGPSFAAKEAVGAAEEQVTPETLVVIAAAVTAFLGKKVRIRSAKVLRPAHAGASAWSQQGRVLVHGSHSLRMRG